MADSKVPTLNGIIASSKLVFRQFGLGVKEESLNVSLNKGNISGHDKLVQCNICKEAKSSYEKFNLLSLSQSNAKRDKIKHVKEATYSTE